MHRKAAAWAKRFLFSEDGATTSDFVVLAAAVVGLGFAMVMTVSTGASRQGSSISRELSGITVDAFGKPRGEEATSLGGNSGSN
ncbi:hypothetical protein [Actibacterium sp. XHP0104]|uniref:hypothetical protein n=1 Tax=Actibacterium sp. XHP0104 TaxID=2984335 RepID=UPI0021E790DE|nr:hypothetical protein [Actibacterium sp. XHP0104]MCV2880967.1 hypothetical protein [Actibacterium sp. XHP0104]